MAGMQISSMLKMNRKGFYRALETFHLAWALGPGWPDTARLLMQRPTLDTMTRDFPMTGRCLNAGCGEGLYLPFLESFGGVTQIVNIDMSIPRYVPTADHGRGRLFAEGSLTHLPFADASFESCLSTEVMEHIEDDNLAMSELSRIMKPGGLLLLSVPEIPSPFDPAHAREGYTFESISALLSRHGLTIVKRKNCMHALARLIMWLWRHPVVSFGESKTPYLPNGLLVLLGLADRFSSLGKPWDLVILARKEG